MAPDDHCEVRRDKRLLEARQRPKVPGQNQLRLIQKLALNMGMLANDAVVAFCQLYTVPVLQSLGTPVTFVSLTPFISSPLSVLVLPVLGYFSDRGKNLPRRKVFATWVSFFLSVAGLVLISSASMTLLMRSSDANWTRLNNGSTDPNDVHLKTTPTYMVSPDLDLDPHKNAPSAHPAMNAGNASWFLNESDPAHLIRYADSKKQLPLNLSDEDWESGHVPYPHELSNTSTPDNSSHHTTHLPLTAVMGIVGFALTEVGYDASSTSVKSLVVTCSPREAHTSVIVLGLLMAAVGGCLAGTTGLTDLSTVLVKTAGEESLLSQITVQVFIILAVIVVCVICSSLTARNTAKRVHIWTDNEEDISPDFESGDPATAVTSLQGDDVGHDDVVSGRKDIMRQERPRSESVKLIKDLNGEIESKRLLTNSDNFLQVRYTDCDTPNDSNTLYISPGATSDPDYFETNAGGEETTCTGSAQLFHNSVKICTTVAIHSQDEKTKDVIEDDEENIDEEKRPLIKDTTVTQATDDYDTFANSTPHAKISGRCRISRAKLNLVVACVTTYFGEAVLSCYNFYVTDFLGKVVYRGNPAAARGSAQLAAYDEGVEKGSLGILLLYVSSVVVNLLHSRLLEKIGLKIDLVFSHMLVGAAILTLVLTESLWVYYVTSVLLGLQRVAFYTVPTIVANDYAQHQAKHAGANARVSSTMALLTCMQPLSYATIYPLTGPLITVTGNDATPLYMGSAFSFLSAFTFMLYNIW